MKSYLHLICTILLFGAYTSLQATPNVSFTASTTSGPLPLAVSFNAAATSDSQSGLLQYMWTFGDGNQTSATGTLGKTASNTYVTNGTFTVTLTVMNLSNFAVGTKTKTITVTVPTGTYSYPVDAAHDAYWTGSSKVNNSMLHVGAGKTTYLKYTIPNVEGDITGAKLQMTYSVIASPQSGAVNVSRGTNTSWTETTLSNSNKPSPNKNYGNFSTNTSTIKYTRTITASDISEGGTINFILTSSNSSAHIFASSEESFQEDRPKLILTVNNSSTPTSTCTKVADYNSGVDSRGRVYTRNASNITITTPRNTNACSKANWFDVARVGAASDYADYRFTIANENWSDASTLSLNLCQGAVRYRLYIRDANQGYTNLGDAVNGGSHTFNLPTTINRKDKVTQVLLRVFAAHMTAGQSVRFYLNEMEICKPMPCNTNVADYNSGLDNRALVYAKNTSNVTISQPRNSNYCGKSNWFDVTRVGGASDYVDYRLNLANENWATATSMTINMCQGANKYQVYIKDANQGYTHLGYANSGGSYTFTLPSDKNRKDRVNQVLFRVHGAHLSAGERVRYVLNNIQICGSGNMPAPNLSEEEYLDDLDMLEDRSEDIAMVDVPQAVSLYPNPTSSFLNVKGIEDEAAIVEVFNSVGQLLERRQSIGTIESTLDVGHLQAGMYVLVIHQKGEQQVLKFVKE